MTSRRFIKDNPDVARRFMIAIVEGIHMARTQKDRTLRMLSKQLKEMTRGFSKRSIVPS